MPVALPSAIAYAEVGRLDDARVELALTEESAHLWEGPARPGAVAEARAVLARAEGDEDTALAELERAVELFEQAGQPVADVFTALDGLMDHLEDPAPFGGPSARHWGPSTGPRWPCRAR